MTSETCPVDCCPSMLTEEAMCHLVALAEKLSTHAMKLSEAIRDVIAAEVFRRSENKTRNLEGRLPPFEVSIPFAEWTNSDVAAALIATFAISTRTDRPECGEFTDAWLETLTKVAAIRLEESVWSHQFNDIPNE